MTVRKMTMKFKRLMTLILAAMLLSPLAAASDPPSSNGKSAGDPEWLRDLQKWRDQRATALQAPGGWLSLIALGWLKEGDNSFGYADDNRIQIAGKGPAHIGIVHLEKGFLRLLPPAEGFPKELMVNGNPAKEQELVADSDDRPSLLRLNTLTIFIIHRDEQFGIRVKDLQAPTRVGFHGLHWYAPDDAYRVRAHWIPYNPPKVLDIPTAVGTTTHLPAPGVAEFMLNGKVFRLEPVIENPNSAELFFIVRDTTSKTTTYGAGRFLYSEPPNHGVSEPGEVWLDFNRLINPPCAYTAYATCPLPPPQNRLDVAIPAGEQRYHD
jgi:uncharacterized protein